MSNQTVQTRARLQIGEWSVERSNNELRRGDATLRVEPKVMEVLLVLAEHADETVSREALIDAVWPGVVVGDEALTQSIIKLRKALGDNPREPSYIATIPKRGYRLIALVEKDGGAPAIASENQMAPAPTTESSSRGVRILTITAGVVMALAAGVYFVESRQPPSAMPAGAEAFDPVAEEKAGLVTVTVLPFETVDGGAEQSYLAHGISSDLMTDLSRLSGLRVINSAGSAAGGRMADVARYVVAGSVQRSGTTLRINVRLTDTRNHEQLWSQRLERPFGDFFAIQNEISRGVAAQLPGRISNAERQQLAKRYTSNAEAYENFLRGRTLFLVRRPEENDQARVYYSKAIDQDPQFARAYAGLAMTYAMDYRYQRTADPAATLTRAQELAESARQIDPDIPEVYWALGFVHAQSRRYEQAIQDLQKAIALNRSYADAYALLGGVYTYTGQAALTIPLLRTAQRLNPDGGYLYFLLLGRAYFFENDLVQALINLREAVKRNPEDIETHVYLAATLVAAVDRPAAELEADEIRAREANFSVRNWLKTYPLTNSLYQQRLLELTALVRL